MAYDTTTHDPVAFLSKVDLPNVFQRSFAGPMDRTSLFQSYSDALNYARGIADYRELSGTSYPGQILTVLDNGDPTVYVIRGGTVTEGVENRSERTLVQLGQQSESGADIYWLQANGQRYDDETPSPDEPDPEPNP